MNRYDLTIVGSGVAGLYAALLAAPKGRVLLVSKGKLEESNTRYAQGGIAVALGPQDSPELHLRDTIAAGDGLCEPERVAILTREAPACILDLLERGVPFDRQGGKLAWTLEAAHTRPRVLHAGGDATGASIESTLATAVRRSNVTVREETVCLGLMQRGSTVTGVRLLSPSGEIEEIESSWVLLATGGAGQLFSRTTNPAVATGDGLAIAYRAGAELMDLEMMQFHPTALALPGAPSFLISEAVRGEGGILRDVTGHAFMTEYHPDRELAPRDVVARSIHRQMAATGSSHVYLDITHLPPSTIETRFPTILRFCRDHGLDPVREPIPVAPAAHYLMGGVRTDADGRTSLAGLFACGEVACTGVHGANRLASNSLLEGLVYARRVVTALTDDAAEDVEWLGAQPLAAPPIAEPAPPPGFRERLAGAMWRDAGLVRSAESLRRVQALISGVSGPDLRKTDPEASNVALLSALVVRSALLREESRGGHFRSDFPRRDPAWRAHIVVSRAGAWTLPVGASDRRLVGAPNA
jgi:L-aspartate oxidase